MKLLAAAYKKHMEIHHLGLKPEHLFDRVFSMTSGGSATHINLNGDPAAAVTDLMIAVEHVLAHVPAKTALQLLGFCSRRIDATEARILADRYDKGASDRDVEDLVRTEDNTSKNEAKKRAKRGKATNANPDIANRMSEGKLSTEQADVIADAAAETDGAAACDETLIDDVAATTPEQGRKKAKKFVNDRRDADGVQTKHDRQRRRRGWYRHRLPNGNAAITIHGDDHSIDQAEKAIEAQSDAEYQADGGRDVPHRKHPRSSDQRGFDAAHRIFTRSQSGPSGPRSSADGQRPTPPTSTRDVVHVNVTLDQLTGADKSAIIASDGKPLPRSVFEQIVCGADFIAHIFDGNGELLWQGRKKRLATPAQINGLIARDGGCVQCGAHHSKCVAHHLLPSEAPAQGETNIDNLAFVCDDCHIRIHQRKLTLFYDPGSQTWKTRAAKPHEIPPENQHSKPKNEADRYRTAAELGKPRLDEARSNRRRALF